MNEIYTRVFKCQKGESIGEVLVALLISSLGLVLLASMISSASKMVTSSKSKIEQYIVRENVIVKQDGEGTAATATIKIGANDVQLTDESSVPFNIQIYKNEVLNSPVVTFKLTPTTPPGGGS